jgi:hypothetical protein
MGVAIGMSVRYWVLIPTRDDPDRLCPVAAIVNSVVELRESKAGLTVFWPTGLSLNPALPLSPHPLVERLDGVPYSKWPLAGHFTNEQDEHSEAWR